MMMKHYCRGAADGSRCPRFARRPEGRYVVWGIVERPQGPETTHEQVSRAVAAAGDQEDLWVFSGANSIGVVLNAILCDEPAE